MTNMKQNMPIISLILAAVVLNLVSALSKLDYLWSVLFVLGGLSFLLSIATFKNQRVSRNDLKLFFGFYIFSNIMTLALEMVMLKFNVWGFTHHTFNLTGFTLLDAPIEEYVYWSFCPIIVGLSYINISRGLAESVSVEPAIITKLAELLKTVQLKTQSPRADSVNYVDPQNEVNGQYKQGAKYPVYIWVQILIIVAIIAMARYFHGSYKALAATAVIFFAVAFPHEAYAVTHGFWIYNTQHLIGPFIGPIPIEGYFMYFISPICGGMMLDLADRKFFKQDV